jgi:hypothetical protein
LKEGGTRVELIGRGLEENINRKRRRKHKIGTTVDIKRGRNENRNSKRDIKRQIKLKRIILI